MRFSIDVHRLIEDARAESLGVPRDLENASRFTVRPALDAIVSGLKLVIRVISSSAL